MACRAAGAGGGAVRPGPGVLPARCSRTAGPNWPRCISQARPLVVVAVLLATCLAMAAAALPGPRWCTFRKFKADHRVLLWATRPGGGAVPRLAAGV